MISGPVIKLIQKGCLSVVTPEIPEGVSPDKHYPCFISKIYPDGDFTFCCNSNFEGDYQALHQEHIGKVIKIINRIENRLKKFNSLSSLVAFVFSNVFILFKSPDFLSYILLSVSSGMFFYFFQKIIGRLVFKVFFRRLSNKIKVHLK